MSDIDPRQEMRKISRRSFLWAGAALIGTYAGFRFLDSRRPDDGIPWPLRRGLQLNESVWTDAFSEAAMAPTFHPNLARTPIVNGILGLESDIDLNAWRLHLIGASGQSGPIEIALEEIRSLPRFEVTTQLYCIEGWSVVVSWAGARFRDFLAKYRPAGEGKFVYLETPDRGYYVGLDMQSATHPQTLLCYEMNGAPLTLQHGAPLRLVIPTKYGIKSLKRIGLIRYTDQRPPDFWAERGYDWHSGL